MDLDEVVEKGVFESFFEWIVPAVSLAMLGLLTALARLLVDDSLFFAADLLLPVLFVALIVWQGLQLESSDLNLGHRQTIAAWYALGVYTMLGLGGWTLLLGVLGQLEVPVVVELLTEVVAGGLFGLLVGTAQVRAEQNAEAATQAQLEQEFLERQQETNLVLNRILRHHLLNSLTVIRGQAQLLSDTIDDEGEPHVDTVIDEATEMAETIEEIRTITRTLTEEPELVPVDLASVIESQLTCARTNYPKATFEVDGTLPDDVAVAANDLLGRALANVLNNAVEHNTATDPQVVVSVSIHDQMVRISVADNGAGIPAGTEDEMFEASERGVDSDGDGLGLFLTASAVRQYGGDVCVEENTTDGAVVALELPRADSQ